MLTRQQIQRLAQRYRIGMQAQERDYVEHLALYLLYTRSQDLVFKGGTALRLAYHGNCYSEDLDFDAPLETTVEEVRARWEAVADGLADYGIGAELRREWQSSVGYSVDLGYRGPLYDGRDRSKSKIRLDMNLRPEVAASQPVLISSEYADVRPFMVTVITREHLFAEKVRALLVRGKPRDLYDVWIMLGQGVRLDAALLQQKLATYDMSWSPGLLVEAMDRVEPDWEQDLRPLLTQLVPHVAVRQAVRAAMADLI